MVHHKSPKNVNFYYQLHETPLMWTCFKMIHSHRQSNINIVYADIPLF